MSGWCYVGNFQEMTRQQLKEFIRWVALEAPAAGGTVYDLVTDADRAMIKFVIMGLKGSHHGVGNLAEAAALWVNWALQHSDAPQFTMNAIEEKINAKRRQRLP